MNSEDNTELMEYNNSDICNFHSHQIRKRVSFFSKFPLVLKLFKQRLLGNVKYNIGAKANNFLVTGNNQIVNIMGKMIP